MDPLIKKPAQTTIQPEQFFDKLLTKKQLADQLSVSQSFINKLKSNEGLPFRQLGRAVRFSAKEVMGWLQQRSKP